MGLTLKLSPVWLTLLMVMLMPAISSAGDVMAPNDCVILLHGLARTEKSMQKLEEHLKSEGFYVINLPYASRKKTIEELSLQIIPKAYKECLKLSTGKIHFVTHSMGGILVRYYLEHNRIENLGRVVMLSPPNHGSEVVDKLKNFKFFKWLNGPAGQQLGTDEESIPNQLGPAYYETGIITGDRSINLFLSLLIPGKDDGKVSIESAKLEGMKDFLVVHKSHPFIMSDAIVCKHISSFIKKGTFNTD